MVYKEIKNMFTDTEYNLMYFTIENEFQEEQLTMNLYHKKSNSYVELRIIVEEIETIDQLKEKVSNILNMS